MPLRVNYLKRPKLKRPALIAGLPGIAQIGKLGVEYLIHKLGAEKFVELYSRYLPEWVIREGGLIKTLKVDFSCCRPNGSECDLVFVTADAQAATTVGQYKLVGEILDVAEEQGVDTVTTMAAYVLSPEEPKARAVGVASNGEMAKFLRDNEVELLSGGMIVGMNGLLPGLAATRGIRGFCLLGATRGGLLDVRATEAVLRTLGKLLRLKLDLEELRKHAMALPKFRMPSFGLPIGVEEEVSYIR